jgi:hypothetical protein
VLTRASARLILRVRDELREELGALRGSLRRACGEAASDEKISETAQAALARASKVYTIAFEALRERFDGRDDDEGVRITTGYVSLAALVLPADVAMRSGLAAARSMNMRGVGPPSSNGSGSHTRPAPDRLVVLIVKPLNARPDTSPDDDRRRADDRP